jgi:hypothetical protein
MTCYIALSGRTNTLYSSTSLPPADETYITVESPPRINNYYLKNGSILKKPQTDLPHPVFDIETETWSTDTVKIWASLRMDRNRLLSRSDWTQILDSPVSYIKRSEWTVYRQALRDLPDNTPDPANPSWPTEPSS